MARKYSNLVSLPAAAEVAAMNLRMATFPLARLRPPPRVRKIPTVRRRLPVTMIPNFAQSVIIRHSGQNLGSAVGETQPVHVQRF